MTPEQRKVVEWLAAQWDTQLTRDYCDALRALLANRDALEADRDSWRQQADDRTRDAVEFGKRAVSAEARCDALEAMLRRFVEPPYTVSADEVIALISTAPATEPIIPSPSIHEDALRDNAQRDAAPATEPPKGDAHG